MIMQMRFTKFFRAMPQVYTVCCVVLCVALFSFFFLQPTVLSSWNPVYRKFLLSQFLSETKRMQEVDPQKFWLFRERYSGGNMSINPQSVGIFQTYRVIGRNASGATELFNYQSARLKSTDSITTDRQALTARYAEVLKKATIVQQSPSHIIADLPGGILMITFQKPISEMKKANGFFDYLPNEEKILDGTEWLNTTYIQKE